MAYTAPAAPTGSEAANPAARTAYQEALASRGAVEAVDETVAQYVALAKAFKDVGLPGDSKTALDAAKTLLDSRNVPAQEANEANARKEAARVEAENAFKDEAANVEDLRYQALTREAEDITGGAMSAAELDRQVDLGFDVHPMGMDLKHMVFTNTAPAEVKTRLKAIRKDAVKRYIDIPAINSVTDANDASQRLQDVLTHLEPADATTFRVEIKARLFVVGKEAVTSAVGGTAYPDRFLLAREEIDDLRASLDEAQIKELEKIVTDRLVADVTAAREQFTLEMEDERRNAVSGATPTPVDTILARIIQDTFQDSTEGRRAFMFDSNVRSKRNEQIKAEVIRTEARLISATGSLDNAIRFLERAGRGINQERIKRAKELIEDHKGMISDSKPSPLQDIRIDIPYFFKKGLRGMRANRNAAYATETQNRVAAEAALEQAQTMALEQAYVYLSSRTGLTITEVKAAVAGELNRVFSLARP